MEIRNPSANSKGASVLASGGKKPRASALLNGGANAAANGASNQAANTSSRTPDFAHATFSHVAKTSSIIVKPAPQVAMDLSEEKLTFADRLGIWLSFICMIHCLATPVLLLIFPALQAMEVSHLHESFHMALLLILPVVAVIAFIPGYRRHRSREVFYWALPGLAIIAYVALWFDDGSWLATAVSVTGSLFLIRAHSVNRKLCACCHPPARARAR